VHAEFSENKSHRVFKDKACPFAEIPSRESLRNALINIMLCLAFPENTKKYNKLNNYVCVGRTKRARSETNITTRTKAGLFVPLGRYASVYLNAQYGK
jgi:hypothetical protein